MANYEKTFIQNLLVKLQKMNPRKMYGLVSTGS